jgi:hypothetical protein
MSFFLLVVKGEKMETVKLSHELPMAKIRKTVLVYGSVCAVFYIAFMLIMKLVGLLHITELRMVNYVILCLVCLFEIRQWIKQRHTYVPFLQVFGTAFFTGLWSFLLFSAFCYVYSRYDAELRQLFFENTYGVFPNVPSIVLFFEGSAASIIVAFINMQYFRRYEEGEKSPDKVH